MKRVFAISMLGFTACGSSPGNAPFLPAVGGAGAAEAGSGGITSSAGNGGSSAGSGGVTLEPPPPSGRLRCRAPAGMGSPGTIEHAVALLNALPKPTSVACFVESLDRPLAIAATNSVFSAQPAASTSSPRVFLRIAQLWLSIVIDGDSSELLEFGYLIANAQETVPRSIKGELHFPVTGALEARAPYERVLYDTGTICRFCHFDERAESVPGIDGVFSSVAFRPRPETRVSIDYLREAARTCDRTTEPHRCEMFSAVFDGGPVVDAPFPGEMPTFF